VKVDLDKMRKWIWIKWESGFGLNGKVDLDKMGKWIWIKCEFGLNVNLD
jgi:hypothetical protein